MATVSSAFRRTKHCKYFDALRVLLYTINSTVLLPSQASTLLRLVCRRVASRYPAPGFGSAIQSPCVPYRLRHGVLAISGSGSITRCYDTRTYIQPLHTYEKSRKKDPVYVTATRAGSSAARVANSTADTLVLLLLRTWTCMYSRGKLLGDPWVLVESSTPGRQLLPESGLCSSDGAIHNQRES